MWDAKIEVLKSFVFLSYRYLYGQYYLSYIFIWPMKMQRVDKWVGIDLYVYKWKNYVYEWTRGPNRFCVDMLQWKPFVLSFEFTGTASWLSHIFTQLIPILSKLPKSTIEVIFSSYAWSTLVCDKRKKKSLVRESRNTQFRQSISEAWGTSMKRKSKFPT